MSESTAPAIPILVAGEALIDFVPAGDGRTYRALPGGSPFNVAVGLARLGVSAGYLGKLSTDAFGRQLREALHVEGVSPDYIGKDPGPTTLAVVTQEPGEDPKYAFYGHCAADQQLRSEDLPDALPDGVRALHLGSYAMARTPIGETLTQLMRREADRRVLSFDPNVRLSLIPDLDRYREQLDEWVRLSRIVKLSVADLDILFPGMTDETLAERWLSRGYLRLLVVTHGADGARAFAARHAVHVPAVPVSVVDPVGAGDAFTAGLLAWLDRADRLSMDALDALSQRDARAALQFAGTVAAMACTRPGANPPQLHELPARNFDDAVA